MPRLRLSRPLMTQMVALTLLGICVVPRWTISAASAATPSEQPATGLESRPVQSPSLGTLGSSMAIYGNTVLVGAPDFNDFTGAVLILVHSHNKWHRKAKISMPFDSGGPSFGASVAITRAGSSFLAVIGDPGGAAGQGDAYVYGGSGSSWHQLAVLTDPDHGPAGGADFGTSVAISGSTIIVGADAFWAKKPAVGAAYIFTHSGTGWHFKTRLTAPNAHRGGLFGMSVAIKSVTAVVGAPNIGPGTAYVFTRIAGTWRRQSIISSPARKSYAWFGSAMALASNTLVVGADNAADFAGEVFTYSHDGSVWKLQDKIVNPDRVDPAGFGISVAIQGQFLLVGAPDDGAKACGNAYVYANSRSRWNERDVIADPQCVDNDEFGSAVAISGRIAVVGARLKNDNSGAVYSITLP